MRRTRLESLALAIPRVIVGGAIFFSIGLNLANIAGRYLFGSPILWAEEILTYLMVWSVFVGAVLVTWEGRHLKMDLLSVSIPPPFRQICGFIGAVIFVAVCALGLMQSWKATGLMMDQESRSVAAEIPMAIPHSALVFGFAGMLIAVLLRFREYATGAFGSDTEATTKQVTETFGLFEGAEQADPAREPSRDPQRQERVP